MKKRIINIVIICFLAFQASWAQSQLVSDLTNAVVDMAGSFLDNPYNHSNTKIVYENTIRLKGVLDELYRQVPREAYQDYYAILNMQKPSKKFRAHYSRNIGAKSCKCICKRYRRV